MADRLLYLIRHGQYDRDRESSRFGHLTRLGKRQARHLARRVRTLPIDVIHTSTFPRAVETAEILGEVIDAPLKRSPLLRESLPSIRGGRSLAVQRTARERFDRAYARYFRRTRGRDRHELVVCHGNITRYLMLKAADVDPRAWMRFVVPCLCSLTIVRVTRSHGVRVQSYNDVEHLPDAMRLRF